MPLKPIHLTREEQEGILLSGPKFNQPVPTRREARELLKPLYDDGYSGNYCPNRQMSSPCHVPYPTARCAPDSVPGLDTSLRTRERQGANRKLYMSDPQLRKRNPCPPETKENITSAPYQIPKTSTHPLRLRPPYCALSQREEERNCVKFNTLLPVKNLPHTEWMKAAVPVRQKAARDYVQQLQLEEAKFLDDKARWRRWNAIHHCQEIGERNKFSLPRELWISQAGGKKVVEGQGDYYLQGYPAAKDYFPVGVDRASTRIRQASPKAMRRTWGLQMD